MKHPTQHEKIIALCSDGEFHCQREFWNISKSPHKRRAEITEDYGHVFEDRPCIHGTPASKDFKMTRKLTEKIISSYEVVGGRAVLKYDQNYEIT